MTQRDEVAGGYLAGAPARGYLKPSERELEVLLLSVSGLTAKEVGARLGLSARTVENYKRTLYWKFGVQNLAQLIVAAMRNGIIR